MSPEQLTAAGLNANTTTHVDFVVRSPERSVYGLTADGAEEAILASGEWAFTP